MSCFPGLFGDPCVPVSDLLRGQWIAMRVIAIVAAVAGLALSLYFFIDHRKARNGFKSPMAVGTMLIVISYFSILLFYCIDPGALRAKEGGFYTPSYEAGMTTFIITASSLSATATGFVTAYWVDLANPASPKVFLEMSLVANLTWVAVAIYFLVVGVLNIAIPVNNGSLTVLEILRGLQTMGTFATALVASIAGILVLRRLDKAQEFRDFTETDLKRVQRVKIFLWCFVVAQLLCTSGEWIVVWFPTQIAATGPRFIWLGVFYPGALFMAAFVFILLVLKRKKINLAANRGRGDTLMGPIKKKS